MDKSNKPHGLTGKKKSPEACQRMSDAKRGVPRSDAAKAAIRNGKLGKPRSAEDGKKISDGLRRYYERRSHLNASWNDLDK